jgi:hypothetical protein
MLNPTGITMKERAAWLMRAGHLPDADVTGSACAVIRFVSQDQGELTCLDLDSLRLSFHFGIIGLGFGLQRNQCGENENRKEVDKQSSHSSTFNSE